MKECYKVCLALLLLICVVLGYSLTKINEGYVNQTCSDYKSFDCSNSEDMSGNKCVWFNDTQTDSGICMNANY
uniref:Uncharacterized protein n=1 Tax=viral metagenome TaxID=1070528 RepID=A0A6C0EVR8_9ZZZZ